MLAALREQMPQPHVQPALRLALLAVAVKTIGFEDLTRQSGFDVNELMTLFGVYKKTTPMGFVRFCREMEKQKREQPSADLFSHSLLKKKEDMV